MELQDTRFMRFVTHFWIKYQKFRGVSRVCAIFLNFILLFFKLVFCGIILLILAPHLAASTLRNKPDTGVFQWILYVPLVIICLAVDIPLLLICIIGILVACQLIINGQIVTSLLCGVMCWGLIHTERVLLGALFCKNNVAPVESNDVEDEEERIEYEDDEEEEEELVFCQLFTLGEEMSLLIHHVEMCPDETAFIRVVDEEGYTPLYKRKVRRDKAGNRFIVFNGTNHYLDDKKTQPVITKK